MTFSKTNQESKMWLLVFEELFVYFFQESEVNCKNLSSRAQNVLRSEQLIK